MTGNPGDFGFGSMLEAMRDKLSQYKAKQVQERSKEMHSGEGGAGKVRVVLDGNHKMISLEIRGDFWQEILQREASDSSSQILCGLIRAAYASALEKVQKSTAEGEFIPDDFSKILKGMGFPGSE